MNKKSTMFYILHRKDSKNNIIYFIRINRKNIMLYTLCKSTRESSTLYFPIPLDRNTMENYSRVGLTHQRILTHLSCCQSSLCLLSNPIFKLVTFVTLRWNLCWLGIQLHLNLYNQDTKWDVQTRSICKQPVKLFKDHLRECFFLGRGGDIFTFFVVCPARLWVIQPAQGMRSTRMDYGPSWVRVYWDNETASGWSVWTVFHIARLWRCASVCLLKGNQ